MASFLASCADLPNLREHLERALILLPHPPHIGRLWDMYARIEAQFGTASSQVRHAAARLTRSWLSHPVQRRRSQRSYPSPPPAIHIRSTPLAG
eukprot:scaffold31086_cov84-Isochrysis_galbana.AAC.1